MQTIYSFSAQSNDGRMISLDAYRGQVLLIVNTASKCGFTPQYDGLEALQRQFGSDGFSVLGFPCNQFGGQEPGDDAEIKNFCETRFHTSFPLFAKIDVNGVDAHPLFQYLCAAKPGWLGQRIRWNFTKFLVGRDGAVVARYAPMKAPAKLQGAIQKAVSIVPNSL
jgi:glutathione peroxidase